MRNSNESGDQPARIVVKESTPHDIVIAGVLNMPFPLYKREFVGRTLALDDGESLLFVAETAEDRIDYGTKFSTVRGVTRVWARFKPLCDDQCSVVLFQYLDAGGNVSSSCERHLSFFGSTH
jgi:hypothetical protein